MEVAPDNNFEPTSRPSRAVRAAGKLLATGDRGPGDKDPTSRGRTRSRPRVLSSGTPAIDHSESSEALGERKKIE